MSQYTSWSYDDWQTPTETSGSIQCQVGQIEISAINTPNTGIRINQGDIVGFDGTVYVRSVANTKSIFTTVPFDIRGGGGGGGGGGGSTYTLPTASATIKGGVKIGSGLTMTGEVLSAKDPLPNYTTNVQYKAGDKVVYNNAIYQCTNNHTSTSTFNPANWQILGASSGATIDFWAGGTNYSVNNLVIYDNAIYYCKTANNDSTWDGDKWQLLGKVPIATSTVLGGIKVGDRLSITSSGVLSADVQITDWKDNTPYKAKDIVIYDKKFYRAKNDHTSGATFTPNDWDLLGGSGDGNCITKWATNTEYKTSNVVIKNGSLYYCLADHTSSAFDTDISKWELLYSDLKLWDDSTYYPVGVTAIHNNKIYRCKIAHTSGSTFDSTEEANWDLLSGGSSEHLLLNWKPSTKYSVNELVYSNGSVFRCNTAHTSGTTGLATDIANWTLITSDIKAWNPSTSYVAGVTVIQGNDIYRCDTTHTSGASFDTTEKANWTKLGSGGTTISDWASGTSYAVDDLVIYNKKFYKCLTANSDTNFSPVNWQEISGLFDWASGVGYLVGDVVISNNKLYKCTTAHTSSANFDTNEQANWQLIGNNIEPWVSSKAYDVGDIAIYAGTLYRCKTAHTSSTFSGDIGNWTSIYAYIPAWKDSIYYPEGATVIVNGKLYQCKTAHTSGTTFSTTNWQLIGGSSVDLWKVNTPYVIGDLVIHDNKIYRCNADHTSGTTFSSTNWKIVSDTVITNWASNTEYNVDNVVIANNSLFHCNTAHTSSTNFSSDTANWDLMFADIKSWSTGKYYVAGVTAIQNNKLYRCVTSHNARSSFDSTEKANWIMICGSNIDYWIASTQYDVGDIVLYNGSVFRCKTANNSSTFSTTNFELITSDLKPWTASTQYVAGTTVINDNIIYQCNTTHTSGTSFNATEKANWDRLSKETIKEWASSTAYEVGDIITKDNRLYRCETAHTSTSTFDPSKFHVVGDFISQPLKVGDVGFVSWQYTLLNDHLALDGGTVNNFKATYPELYDFFDSNSVLTTTQATYTANKALCYYDATNDVATMPDFLDKTVWGGTTIDEKQAGLPNITGGIEIYQSISGHAATITNGCVTTTRVGTNAAGATSTNDFLRSNIDASQSNSIYGNSTTVQPPAIQLIPQIRYRQEVVEGTVEHYDNAPIGTIISFMGVNAPNEFLICDGSTYNINDYWELAEFIKSEFGTYNHFGGDGTTTFAVPDLRGEFLRGTGTNSHAKQGNGANVGEHQDGTEHTNPYQYGISMGLLLYGNASGTYNTITPPDKIDSVTRTETHYSSVNVSNTSQVSANAALFTSRPTNTSVLYCIKYTNSITMNPSNHYSTEEKRIGTWIDGKPLYQKTYISTIPTGADSGNVNIVTDNNVIGTADTIFISEGYIKDQASYGIIHQINTCDTSSSGAMLYSSIFVSTNYNTIRGRVVSRFVGNEILVTIKYTKQ